MSPPRPRTGAVRALRRGTSRELGRWARCRRRFFEIAKAQKTPGLAAQALTWIARPYAIEADIKDKSPDHKLAVRQTEAVPLLAQFHQ
jgi:hypothetical protein